MGVKSLWHLLTPVGRPIMLETIEGKAMAIDSSIWLYQFQATMRDKDGRGLVNAHVLGFLRRICKLLFYGIKPVFVFDGGAPALKRTTINERKKKKSGAAANHAQLAERLLAAQMRREALNHTSSSLQSSKSSKNKGKAPAGAVIIDDDTVYLEDIDNSMPKTPARKVKAKEKDPPSSSKKSRFHDHDPYRLPDINLEEAIALTTRSAPDPRLATEDELLAFIEEMRPEDFDVTSPAFRELPTEVQYEIIGDLRLKSRQTSYRRLENMLRNAPTPLDFSREQIKNLKQRNTLTQQLLTTTDSIGKAHISIPVRIASERNKEYLLVKNEGESGGWILGIRDDGTKSKPIEIDHDNNGERSGNEGCDSDGEMEEVDIPGASVPDHDLLEYKREMALSAIAARYSPKKLAPLTTAKPIQRKTPATPLFDLEEGSLSPTPDVINSDDEELAFAIQASLDSDSKFKVSTPLKTALSIANAGPSRSLSSPSRALSSPSLPDWPIPSQQTSSFQSRSISGPRISDPDVSLQPIPMRVTETRAAPSVPNSEVDSDQDMEEVITSVDSREAHGSGIPNEQKAVSLTVNCAIPVLSATSSSNGGSQDALLLSDNLPKPFSPEQIEYIYAGPSNLTKSSSPSRPNSGYGVESDEVHSEPSRSASPVPVPSISPARRPSPPVEIWDAAHEMDLDAEEGEFARFMSHVKGKDIDDVRREIDDEINSLNQQRKVAMRDSDEITQQMIFQIMTMLRLFGIPYITAPMEAEAQCATLVSLGLVEGIITDDSDVFLFGGLRVFKNMFNQSKTVECFLLNDLGRELGLDRGTLIRLAYLLGSDYVDGVPGVGPVLAMEVLKEFPGDEGLHQFRDWWMTVQTGKDSKEDSKSKFRKNFKKKFKDLYLPKEWPNPAVRDAYLNPTVDDSDEPFKWGLPDLDALRDFLGEELGWPQIKVDELLLPIIQKMRKRQQAAALNKQGNLNEFFDITSGSGTFAPRKRQAYPSKRLQQVVSEFRATQAKLKGRSLTPASGSRESALETDAEDGPAKKKAKSGNDNGKETESNFESTRSTRSRKRTRGRSASSRKTTKEISSDEEYDGESNTNEEPLKVQLRPRPKPAYKENK